MNSNRTSETYVPLSRGLDEHLTSMSGTALKVYIHLLINSVHAGPDKGKCAKGFSEISAQLGLSYEAVRRAVKELKPRYLTYKPAKNQHSVTVFKIIKYKVASDFAPLRSAAIKNEGSTDAAEELLPSPATEHRRSNPRSPLKDKELRVPKKDKKVKKGDGGAKTAPPTFECSHGDCPHETYHKGRIVAEAQGLTFPDDVGSLSRWLREAKALTNYADVDIAKFVRLKIQRDGSKWDEQPLRPAYVAEDLPVHLRKKRNAHDGTVEPNGSTDDGYWLSDREKDRLRQQVSRAEGGAAA